MLFYLLGPIPSIGVAGMSFKEPYIALGFCGGVDRFRTHLLSHHQQGQRKGSHPDRKTTNGLSLPLT